MVQTVRDTVRDALREIRRYGRGQNLNADDAEDTRRAMNQMLARWSIEGLTVPVLTKQTTTLINGQNEYTVGAGQDLAITAPTSIEAVSLIEGSSRTPLESQTVAEFAYSHETQNSRPTKFAYQFDTVGRLYLNTPPDKAYSVELWSSVPLATFTSINDDMATAFGDADIEAIMTNLAIKVASQFGANIKDSLATTARDSKKAIGIRYTEPMVFKS